MTPICCGVEIEELGQPLDPLLEQRLAVHDARASSGRGRRSGEPRSRSCLSPEVRTAPRARARASPARPAAWVVAQLARERHVELGSPSRALIRQTPACISEVVEQLLAAAARLPRGRTRNSTLLLEARDHARCARRRDPQPLAFEKQGVGERREPAHRVQQQRRAAPPRAYVQTLCERRAEDIRHRRRGEPARERPRRTPGRARRRSTPRQHPEPDRRRQPASTRSSRRLGSMRGNASR